MKKTIFINGTVLLWNKNHLDQRRVSVAIENGKITEIGDNINTEGFVIIDCNGLHILPGIIDSQVHFREPGLTHKEDIESGTRSALMGGVTTIFEMPNTKPSTTTKEQFEEKLRLAKNRAHCHYAFYIGAAMENAAELHELEKLPHCSGVKIFMGSSTGSLLVDDETVLEHVLKNGSRRVIVHAEDEARLKERKHLTDTHDVRLHHIWRDEETAMIATKKLIKIARKYQRPVHVLHVTTKQEMEFLKDQKDLATVEVLPQHLTLFAPDCYQQLGTKAQQNPPIREIQHQKALWQAIHNGTVDIIGSDHAPHTLSEKEQQYPMSPSGMPAVQTLVPIMLNHVHHKKLSLEKFIQLVTENPRRIFGIKNKGRIEIGYDADLTVVDLNQEKKINKEWIQSKSGWSPFENMKVTGWVQQVWLNGVCAMKNDQIIIPQSGKAIDFEK